MAAAIGRMGRIIAALERHDREVLRARRHPLLGPASQHCALIEGGSGLSTYAESCTLQLERRTLPGETPAQVLDEIRGCVAECGEQAQVELLLDRPPLVCDREAPIAGCVRQAAAAITGVPPEESGVAYWMDAALFAAAGIPTVDYGPAGAGAHAAVEWVALDSVVGAARVYAEAARRFFNL
jgi:acetylornithine deacetylase